MSIFNKVKVLVVGSTSRLQAERLQFYCEVLLNNVMTPTLHNFLEDKGFHLFDKKYKHKGYFSHKGIHVFNSKELGWKNYRDGDAGKRGYFRADQVAIHELMHAVWHLGGMTSGFKQEVYGLHASTKKKYVNYLDAAHHPQEWFCDQFPRAFLFKATCDPRLRQAIKEFFFKGKSLPDIRLEKGQSAFWRGHPVQLHEDEGDISTKTFAKRFPASTEAINEMLQDSGGDDIHSQWDAVASKVQELAAKAEPTLAKMAKTKATSKDGLRGGYQKYKETHLQVMAYGEVSDIEKLIKKYGEGGKAAQALLTFTFDME